MKRYIRLKERSAITRIHTPPEDYLKIRPTLDNENYFEHTNKDNFLSAEVAIESKNKVFILGGSFVENIYCESNSRFCSVLGKTFGLNGYDLSFINSGVSGSTSLNILNTAINKIIPFKPTHIICFIPTNDGLCLELKGGLWNQSKHYSNLQGIDHKSERDKTDVPEKINQICNVYSTLKTLCTSFNIDLTVCSSPIIDGSIDNFYLYNKTSHEKFSKDRNLVFDSVLEFCNSIGIHTLDLRVAFSNKYELFFDPVHTNAMGSIEVAKYLYEHLEPRFEKYKIDSPKLIQKKLISSLALTNSAIQLDAIHLENPKNQKITLSFEIDCPSEVGRDNCALFFVDFDKNDLSYDQTQLSYSSAVGWYKYILTKAKCKYRISYSFNVPAGIPMIKIGFQPWYTNVEIKISDVQIYIQELE